MADYYTLASTVFVLPDEKQREWALNLVDALENIDSEEIPDEYSELVYEFITHHGDWFSGGDIVPDDDGIWISSMESLDPDHIAWLIKIIMNKFNIREPFIFEWAATCSKPRLDSFGGGACLVTANSIHWFIPGVEARAMLEDGGFEA